MIVGELVLPEVMVGMIDASTTRRPPNPNTCRRASVTALGSSSRPILQVPTGWKIVVPMLPAATARSSSVSKPGPGRCSTGLNGASAGWAAIFRVRRIALAALVRIHPPTDHSVVAAVDSTSWRG